MPETTSLHLHHLKEEKENFYHIQVSSSSEMNSTHAPIHNLFKIIKRPRFLTNVYHVSILGQQSQLFSVAPWSVSTPPELSW